MSNILQVITGSNSSAETHLASDAEIAASAARDRVSLTAIATDVVRRAIPLAAVHVEAPTALVIPFVANQETNPARAALEQIAPAPVIDLVQARANLSDDNPLFDGSQTEADQKAILAAQAVDLMKKAYGEAA